jgi:hypothetical protein
MRVVLGDCGAVGVSDGWSVGLMGREGDGGSVETVVWVDCLRSVIGKGVVGEESTASSVISSDDMMRRSVQRNANQPCLSLSGRSTHNHAITRPPNQLNNRNLTNPSHTIPYDPSTYPQRRQHVCKFSLGELFDAKLWKLDGKSRCEVDFCGGLRVVGGGDACEWAGHALIVTCHVIPWGGTE